MATVTYESKFHAPTDDETKVQLLQLTFDIVHQVEPNPVQILIRSAEHKTTIRGGETVPDYNHITVQD